MPSNPRAKGSRATGTRKSAAGRARRPAAPTRGKSAGKRKDATKRNAKSKR